MITGKMTEVKFHLAPCFNHPHRRRLVLMRQCAAPPSPLAAAATPAICTACEHCGSLALDTRHVECEV